MDEDMKVLTRIIQRALFMHVEAVRNVVALEHHPKAPNSGRTHLSAKHTERENQYYYLNWAAYDALDSVGVQLGSAMVQGEWLLPYRRKCYAETQHRELKRVNEVVSRLQDGLLRTRTAAVKDMFSCEPMEVIVELLLEALNEFNYPIVAKIADQHAGVRQVLRDVLGITDEELIAMMCLGCDEWDALIMEDGRFDRYYQKRAG